MWTAQMPDPGDPAHRLPVEDSYLELLTDTLETLDLSARGQFLQRFLRAITHLDLRESQCLQLWEQTLARRTQLTEKLGRPVSLKTALMDVLSAANLLRVPILIEYEELKQLQINAATDPLTGLYNRRLFEESLQRESNRARRYNHQLALVLLDLHRFKEVNDKFGHPRGDEVLRAAAATLRNSLRTSDSAFRIGGDEFALLLPQTDAAQATSLSRRVEAAFEEAIKSLNLGITVGMDHGVAVYPQDGETVETLIRVADERLYRRKHVNHGKAANGAARPAEPAPARPPVAAPARAPEPEKKPAPEAPPLREVQPVAAPAPAPIPVAAGPAAAPTPAPPGYAEHRKAERVSMAGTHAYALLGESGGRRARVVDIGFGGVGLELGPQEEISGPLLAVLHVPILPPVRVTLQPVWSKKSPAGTLRVGCSFVS
jgi:diguanylate cyclase (GGDEF)-like protein